ncbi:MAG: DNA-binding protein [Mycoplasmataceae bacterium]|jgi:predicted DNA-binding protein with PD1-like motif|nr:DNA-binding protein [Mycoplasmataceae bacterium]
MKYLKISNNQYCLKLERGDEIIKSLQLFCASQKINSGYFSGIGATNNITLGIFDDKTKKYNSHTLKDALEITSLTGNISTLNNQIYLHAHINVSDHSLIVKGGHLNNAIISVTCEIFLTKVNKKLPRYFDKEVGINLLKI